jgi:hypothetical protein
MDPLRQSLPVAQVPRPRPTAKSAQQAAVAPEIASASGLEALLRQSRVTCPTAKLIDGNNHEKLALTFQRAAVAAEIARVEAVEALALAASESLSSPSISPQPTLSESVVSTREPSAASREPSPSASNPKHDQNSQVIRGKNKRPIILSSDDDEPDGNARQKKSKTTQNSICECSILYQDKRF